MEGLNLTPLASYREPRRFLKMKIPVIRLFPFSKKLRLRFCISGILTVGIPSAAAQDLVDPDFAPEIFGPGTVDSLMWHPAGFLYAAVEADKIEGTPIETGLVRFSPDGVWDASYLPDIDGIVTVMHLQADGKWLVAGSFHSIDGHQTEDVARMNSDGSVDTSFSVGFSGSSFPGALGSTSDGKVLVGTNGNPDDVKIDGEWVTLPHLIRLENDGSLDTTFWPSFEGPGAVDMNTILVTADDRIVVGGVFDQVNGESQRGLARLLPDGTLDPAFRPVLGEEDGSGWVAVNALATFDEESMIVGGAFNHVNGAPHQAIAIIDHAGEMDPSFQVSFPDHAYSYAPDPEVRTLLVDSQQRVIFSRWEWGSAFYVVGKTRRVDRFGQSDESFQTDFTGHSVGALLPEDFIALGREDRRPGKGPLGGHFEGGTRDESFAPRIHERSRPLSDPYLMIERPGTGPLIGGKYVLDVNGEAHTGATALTESGEVDPSFQVEFSPAGSVSAFCRMPDGRFLIGGTFVTVNGIERPRLVLVDADGSVEPAFDLGSGPEWEVNLIRFLSMGKVLIAGRFDTVAGVTAKGLALLNIEADGTVTVDPEFRPEITGWLSIDDAGGQVDGKVVLLGDNLPFEGNSISPMIRLNADGSVDETFAPEEDFSTFTPDYLEVDAQDRIYLVGTLHEWNSSVYRDVYRLHADGTLDIGFRYPSRIETTDAIQVLADGGLLVAGSFDEGQKKVAKVDDGGLVVSEFDLGASEEATIHDLRLVAPHSLYLTGDFTTLQGFERNGLARVELGTALPPQVKIVPSAIVASEGEQVTFQLDGIGTNETYQWYCDGVLLVDEVNTDLDLGPLSPLQSGEYSVAATGPGGETRATGSLAVEEYDYAAWAEAMDVPPEEADAGADVDGDGRTNIEEYLARTDPGDPASFFAPVLAGEEAGIELNFATFPGRSYTVQSSVDLETWTTVHGPFPGDGDVHVYSHPAGDERQFFQVHVERP